ncbi:MAG: ribonuclease HII [Clostridia bacterium]|nr:ribonuclease HII [Clostridia bacterium]
MFDYENKYKSMGYSLIAGIDEAGRGPLAGPVCVAIVIMPLDEDKIISKINDSKKLTEKVRNQLYDEIISTAIDYHIELIDENTIDEINILNATKLGMKNCIDKINTRPDVVLIDAVKIDTSIVSESIIKGDALSYNIAAASILAKVTRDRLMLELAKEYPDYAFEKHKGYGTKVHINKLIEYGPCKIHRKSFIKNFEGKMKHE